MIIVTTILSRIFKGQQVWKRRSSRAGHLVSCFPYWSASGWLATYLMFVILITLTRFEDTLVVSCLHTMTILLWINAVFIFALIKLPRIWNTYAIPIYPQLWGENVRKRNYQCSLRTLVISLPRGVPWERRLMVTCRGPETLSLCWLWAILGPCESGISPNPPGSLSLPVPSASTPKSYSYFSKNFPASSLSALSPFSQICLYSIALLDSSLSQILPSHNTVFSASNYNLVIHFVFFLLWTAFSSEPPLSLWLFLNDQILLIYATSLLIQRYICPKHIWTLNSPLYIAFRLWKKNIISYC